MLKRVAGLALGLFIVPHSPTAAQTCDTTPAALVLSGGGAKGIAHIGVLRVMDSLGIHPNLVVGTSMGAVIGAMYASGYTGRQIDSLARALALAELFKLYEPRTPRSLRDLFPLAVWEQGEGGFNLQRAAVREPEANALLNAGMLRGNLLARGNFDSLPVRFRAVATDLSSRKRVVLDSGDLARSVRASMAIPLIFEPEHVNGRYLGDGGLVANIPIEVARTLGARRLIVSDATEHLVDTLRLDSPINLANQLLGYLFTQPKDSLGEGDVFVRPDVEGFASLDFSREKVSELIELGYEAARTSFGALECRPAAAATRAHAIPTHFGTVRVSGGRAADRRFLRTQLGLLSADSVDPALLRERIRELGASDVFKAFWLSPSGTPDSVDLSVTLRTSPPRMVALGIAYDNDLGGRMWAGALDRNFPLGGLESHAAALLGEQRQEVRAGIRGAGLGPHPLAPVTRVLVARESIRRFDAAGDEVKPERIRELVGLLGLAQPLGSRWTASAGIEPRSWHESARGNVTTLGATLRVWSDPRTDGPQVDLNAKLAAGYRLLHVDASLPVAVGHGWLTPSVHYGVGEELPPQLSFVLGGDLGFPGYHLDEFRGDREALARLRFSYPLIGPLQVQGEVVTGRVATGGSAFPGDPWRVGARLGLGADTPIGPIHVEYGRNDADRGAVFVRLGRWF